MLMTARRNLMSNIKTICAALFLFMTIGIAHADELKLRSGDILTIYLPGEPAFDQPFQVDREGQLALPEVGSIEVSGQTVDEAGGSVRAALGTVFRDIERLRLVLKDRRLAVSVLGYVKKPGPIDLPENAKLQMALTAAGGLAEGAQLDQLQIRREGRVIKFDYKNYLDTGNDNAIPVLQPLDIIFVPASPLIGNIQVDFDAKTLTAAGDAANDGSSVKVFGEVHRPGLFGFKEGSSVVDMLMRAGGVTRYAGVEQIRIISGDKPFPFNLREYLDTGDQNLMPSLKAGDTIFIPQRSEQVKTGARTVYVMGNVFKPGAFETKDDASFMDILANAGGPTRFADTRQIQVLKMDGSVVNFDLQGFANSKGAIPLPEVKPGDAILVPEKTDMNEKSWLNVSPNRAVRIIGAVVRPGRYEWSKEMSIIDLVAHAGGPVAAADTAHVQVLKELSDGRVKPMEIDFDKFLKSGGRVSDLPPLEAGDTIVVPELPQDPSDNRSKWIRQAKERSIYILGQVGAPGRYAFNEQLTFLDILSAANGPLKTADLHNIRVTHRGEDGARVSKLNLALYFETGDDSILPTVRPEDVIYVPEQDRQFLDKKKETTIRVLGAVNRPGRYAFDDTMTILDLLAEAGGPTPLAYSERIVVVNRSKSEPRATSFDLVGFARQGDFTKLPVLRAGDTVYVPSEDESPMYSVRTALKDIISIITIGSLAFGG
jgi:protein involved in polysaccharide export with SLBB domain